MYFVSMQGYHFRQLLNCCCCCCCCFSCYLYEHSCILFLCRDATSGDCSIGVVFVVVVVVRIDVFCFYAGRPLQTTADQLRECRF